MNRSAKLTTKQQRDTVKSQIIKINLGNGYLYNSVPSDWVESNSNSPKRTGNSSLETQHSAPGNVQTLSRLTPLQRSLHGMKVRTVRRGPNGSRSSNDGIYRSRSLQMLLYLLRLKTRATFYKKFNESWPWSWAWLRSATFLNASFLSRALSFPFVSLSVIFAAAFVLFGLFDLDIRHFIHHRTQSTSYFFVKFGEVFIVTNHEIVDRVS